jgi:hypothetical protein
LSDLRTLLARFASWVAVGTFWLLWPLLPLLASIAFLNRRYLLDYTGMLRKFAIHLRAVREGPADTFFGTVLGVHANEAPVEIGGHCVQCGNCCMNHRCVFLEPRGGGIFQCGIYTSPLRRVSNCGAFPVSAQDIQRYDCPSYFVVKAEPVRILEPQT